MSRTPAGTPRALQVPPGQEQQQQQQRQPQQPRTSSSLSRSSPASASSPTFATGRDASSASASSSVAGPGASAGIGLGQAGSTGAGTTPRRNRSIHINIKPDPAPSSTGLGLAIPAWLSGGSNTGLGLGIGSSAGTSSGSGTGLPSSSAGSVPHRDFGMSPSSALRRGSVPALGGPYTAATTGASQSHEMAAGLAPAGVHKRGSSAGLPSGVASGSGTTGSPSQHSLRHAAPEQGPYAARWAGTIRNQLHRIERDGLKRSLFWGKGRQLGQSAVGLSYGASPGSRALTSGTLGSGSGSSGGQGGLARAWDRVRRLPDLLFVESEDPMGASAASLWDSADRAAAGDAYSGENETSDTDDLLDEDGASDEKQEQQRKLRLASRSASMGRRRSSARPRPRPNGLQRIGNMLDRTRRMLGISRGGLFVLLLLLALGLYEASTRSGESLYGAANHDVRPRSIRADAKDPFRTLAEAGIMLPSSGNGGLVADASRPSQAVLAPAAEDGDQLGLIPLPKSAALDSLQSQSAKATAILMSWKRLDNLVVVLAHLCAYTGSVFDSVQVWNNNPDVRLTHQMLAAAQCPKYKLRIYNSPGNLLFMARYMACVQADTPHCYFQDDDYLVPSLPALHAHFLRNPEGPPVVAAGDDFPIKSGWEWCFSNTAFDLNACFAWLGYGAFVSRARVAQTLDALTSTTLSDTPFPSSIKTPLGPISSSEMAMLDNAFTTVQNGPPYVIAGPILPLDQREMFSTKGEGDVRNELYIQEGLDRLVRALEIPTNRSPSLPPISAWPVEVSQYAGTPAPLSIPPTSRGHTYWHHTRAVSRNNDALFMTNVANLPPPDAVTYQPHPERNLSNWETALGAQEMWSQGKQWALTWPYTSALNGDTRTAFRGPDTVKKGDYVGLDLLAPFNVEARPVIEVHFMLEHSGTLSDALKLEVSLDGYNWQELRPAPRFSCHVTSHLSTLPSPSFPRTFLSSALVKAAVKSELAAASQWRKRIRLDSCSVKLSTSAGGSRRKGWRFVRLRSDSDQTIGWGVYELKVV